MFVWTDDHGYGVFIIKIDAKCNNSTVDQHISTQIYNKCVCRNTKYFNIHAKPKLGKLF